MALISVLTFGKRVNKRRVLAHVNACVFRHQALGNLIAMDLGQNPVLLQASDLKMENYYIHTCSGMGP
jgi:hypothetical protein